MTLAVVLGAGGERVIAWETGVLAGLADAGIDLRGGDAVLGTSAGSLIAARLALGFDPRDDARRHSARRPSPSHPEGVDGATAFAAFADVWRECGTTLQERRRAMGALALQQGRDEDASADEIRWIARRLGEVERWPGALRIAVVDAEQGRRRILGAHAGVDLARAVAASRAIPVLRPAVRAGGAWCVDGALGSATNADALLDLPAGTAVVITAAADARRGGLDALWADALAQEAARLRGAGWHVVLVAAGADDHRAMGPDPLLAADPPAAVAAGRRRGRVAALEVGAAAPA